MMEELWETAIAVAGIAAIGAFVFWSLYKQWLTLSIFSQLSQKYTFIIMLVFLVLTFLSGLAMLVAHIELKSLETPKQVEESRQTKDLIDEVNWRLNEMIRIFRILEEGMKGTSLVTIQDYQDYSGYIDKLFRGEAYFYKQYDSEKLVALVAKLISLKEASNIQDLRSYLSLLERTHWDQRNYNKIINQLESFPSLVQSQPNSALQLTAPSAVAAEFWR